jgi:hypothetical protein
VIDRSGEWWTGTEARDVEEYLHVYTQDGYPADRFEQPTCPCGHAVFRLDADRDEGCARRACAACGAEHFVCDSAEIADQSLLEPVTCVCGSSEFDVGVAFSHHPGGEVRWISVGVRCVECGVLGCPVEWEIDYAPTTHLYALV